MSNRGDLRRERARLRRQEKKTKPNSSAITPEAKSKISSGQPKQPQQNTAQPASRYFHGFLALMTILGGTWVIYDLRPKIQVSSFDSLNAEDAFATQFTVKNDSLFDLGDVRASCTAISVDTTWHDQVQNLKLGDIYIDSIPPGQTATIPCPFRVGFGGPAVRDIASADVVLNIAYRYVHFWKVLIFNARFKTQPDRSGKLHWLPQPMPSTHH